MHIGDSGFDPATGAPFQVTELSAYPSLLELVRLCPLSPIEASTLLRKLATVLDTAHSSGFANLSLKPTKRVGGVPRSTCDLLTLGCSVCCLIAGGEVPPGTRRGSRPNRCKRPGRLPDASSAALATFFATGRSYRRSCQALVDMPAWKQELCGCVTRCLVRASDRGSSSEQRSMRSSRALAVEVGARFSSVGESATAFEHAVRGAAGLAQHMPRLSSGAPPGDGVDDAAAGSRAPPWPLRCQNLFPPDDPRRVAVLGGAVLGGASSRACAGAGPRSVTAEAHFLRLLRSRGPHVGSPWSARSAHSRRSPGESDVLATLARDAGGFQRDAPLHDRTFGMAPPASAEPPPARRFRPSPPRLPLHLLASAATLPVDRRRADRRRRADGRLDVTETK